MVSTMPRWQKGLKPRFVGFLDAANCSICLRCVNSGPVRAGKHCRGIVGLDWKAAVGGRRVMPGIEACRESGLFPEIRSGHWRAGSCDRNHNGWAPVRSGYVARRSRATFLAVKRWVSTALRLGFGWPSNVQVADQKTGKADITGISAARMSKNFSNGQI